MSYLQQKYYVIVLHQNITKKEGAFMNEKTAVERLQKQYNRQNEFIKKNYDRLSVTVPKGTRARIDAVLNDGEKVNSFINSLIEKELKRREKKQENQD